VTPVAPPAPCTREQFVAAVEAGIAAAEDLPSADRDALRTFARGHTGLVAFGTFEAEGCGCPLTICRLRSDALSASTFYGGYDRYVNRHLPVAEALVKHHSPRSWRLYVSAGDNLDIPAPRA
jgi:hypothetical protein